MTALTLAEAKFGRVEMDMVVLLREALEQHTELADELKRPHPKVY